MSVTRVETPMNYLGEPMNYIPVATSATWRELCLAAAETLENAALTYRMGLDEGPDSFHNRDWPWPERKSKLEWLLNHVETEAAIYRRRADEGVA